MVLTKAGTAIASPALVKPSMAAVGDHLLPIKLVLMQRSEVTVSTAAQ